MIGNERGRVPFAVVAVLLLVGSATVATTVGPAPSPDAPAVDVVVDRTEAEGHTALRRAVRSAASDAASEPVIEPANTTVGRALGTNETFRNSLRLRVYAAAREGITTVERRRGDVVATTDLPAIDASDPASVRAAIDRVNLAVADSNGTALTVRVRNVTTTVRRGDRVLDRSRYTPRVTVASPVLALHDRVTAYEERLNAGVTRPGLEQRLTAILNVAGWGRGYAQYGGAPIGNVISNDHVEVTTNAALLDVQRATIGEVDDGGLRGLELAVGKLAVQEYLALSPGSSPYLEQVLDRQSVVAPEEIDGLDVPARNETMTVSVNRTAEDAFLQMIDEDYRSIPYLDTHEPFSLASVVDDTYAADVRASSQTLDRSGGRPGPAPTPGQDWERVDSRLDESVSVSAVSVSTDRRSNSSWHPLETYTRRVVSEYERTTTWQRGAEQTTTESSSRERTTVRITLEGNHASNVPGPDRRIDGVHERGAGPLDGPNLAGIERAAIDRLLEDRGGRDAVARRAADGTLDTDPITVAGERPDGLRPWLYRDLRDLRERVGEISVAVDRRDVGTFAVNPPGMLRTKILDRRAELLDVPTRYDGVADRARVAARARYLSLVSRALDERAKQRQSRRGRLGDVLGDADAGSVEDLQRSVHAAVENPAARKPALDGPGGPVHLRVDAAPGYLELGSIDQETVPAVDGETTPLAARNVNVFTLPYGEVIGGFLDVILSGPERTELGTAARTLRSGDAVGVEGTTSIDGIDVTLEEVVAQRTDAVEDAVETTLKDHDVGVDTATRRTLVETGLSEWEGTADRAVAISNGSAAGAILNATDERASLSAVERDRLALDLDRTIRDTLAKDAAQPRAQVVEDVGEAIKSETASAIRDVVEEYKDDAVEKVTRGKFTSLPNGLPLAPVPGYWYATTNVWHVEVEGEYARFGVRASRGRPSSPGAGSMYARDGGTVTLDVDADGDTERLGRSTRVQFSAEAYVVVVVPPGAQGVGDVSGPRDERSEGWPLGGE